VEIQAAVLWAVQNKFVDDVPVDRIKEFQNKLTEYLTTRKADLLKKLSVEKAISDALAGELKTVVTEFKQTFDMSKPKEPAKPEPAKEAPSKKATPA
jgi:F-type H+-transporting ATPase subunit alpha